MLMTKLSLAFARKLQSNVQLATFRLRQNDNLLRCLTSILLPYLLCRLLQDYYADNATYPRCMKLSQAKQGDYRAAKTGNCYFYCFFLLLFQRAITSPAIRNGAGSFFLLSCLFSSIDFMMAFDVNFLKSRRISDRLPFTALHIK